MISHKYKVGDNVRIFTMFNPSFQKQEIIYSNKDYFCNEIDFSKCQTNNFEIIGYFMILKNILFCRKWKVFFLENITLWYRKGFVDSKYLDKNAYLLMKNILLD